MTDANGILCSFPFLMWHFTFWQQIELLNFNFVPSLREKKLVLMLPETCYFHGLTQCSVQQGHGRNCETERTRSCMCGMLWWSYNAHSIASTLDKCIYKLPHITGYINSIPMNTNELRACLTFHWDEAIVFAFLWSPSLFNMKVYSIVIHSKPF